MARPRGGPPPPGSPEPGQGQDPNVRPGASGAGNGVAASAARARRGGRGGAHGAWQVDAGRSPPAKPRAAPTLPGASRSAGRGPFSSRAAASTKWLTPSSGLGRRAQGSRRADLLFILPSARPSRCPGSERSRGRWKFLWIEHGAEARWAVWVGSGLPPHPVPHPLPPPSSPERPFMPPLGVPSLAPPGGRAGAGPAGPEEVASDPSPSLGEAAGRRETEWDGPLLGALCRPGPPLTSGSSSVKREPLYRQGKQCVGRACGCSSRKTLGTRGPSQVLLAGRPTGTGGA